MAFPEPAFHGFKWGKPVGESEPACREHNQVNRWGGLFRIGTRAGTCVSQAQPDELSHKRPDPACHWHNRKTRVTKVHDTQTHTALGRTGSRSESCEWKGNIVEGFVVCNEQCLISEGAFDIGEVRVGEEFALSSRGL